MTKHRQMVSLTDPQTEFLKTEAARLGISVSDTIRRIVDQHREARGVRVAQIEARAALHEAMQS